MFSCVEDTRVTFNILMTCVTTSQKTLQVNMEIYQLIERECLCDVPYEIITTL